MRISCQWLSQFLDLEEMPIGKVIAERLTARGLEVESIHDQARGLGNVISARILERAKHPQADRLSLCRVEIATGQVLEIVCGATNMKAGDIVALAQVGAELPNGVKIQKSKIRGVESHGMLCSEVELGLKEASEGILILPQSTAIGQPIARVLGRQDTVLEFSLTPNRGDCLSHLGIARELSAALSARLKMPWKDLPELAFAKTSTAPIKTAIESDESTLFFLGCMIEGVKVGPSPDWLRLRLEGLGHRSINNVVDATNLVLLELGHPTHAYDADQIQGDCLTARRARAGERVKLLDDSELLLSGEELVIADSSGPVGLAGVMGGAGTQVTTSTRRVFLECAEFSPKLIRRAAKKHQKSTDASHRFERGIDPEGGVRALSRLARLVMEVAGGKLAGTSAVSSEGRAPLGRWQVPQIEVSSSKITEVLGGGTTSAEAQTQLESLGCTIEALGGKLRVRVPSYRWDLRIPEDLVEEVARSVGYDRIPSTVPVLTSLPGYSESALRFKRTERVRDRLAQMGLREAIHFSFNRRDWIGRFSDLDPVRVLNPMSEDQEVLVSSLLPGLVSSVRLNWAHHFSSDSPAIRLFELRPTFAKAVTKTESEVEERWRLAIALSGPRVARGLAPDRGECDFFDLKGIIEDLFKACGCSGLTFDAAPSVEVPDYLHPGRSARVSLRGGRLALGWAGQLHPKSASELKIREPLYIAELDWDAVDEVMSQISDTRSFEGWSEYPSVDRDFALLMPMDVQAARIVSLAELHGRPILQSARVFDVYRGKQVAEGMTSVAVRVIFSSNDRSLNEAEVSEVSGKILTAWERELGVKLRQ